MPSSQKPLVAILEMADIPISDPESKLEQSIIGDLAEVKHYPVTDEASYPDEIWNAAAIMQWNPTRLSANGIQKLNNCKIIARIGVGYDQVDLKAAAAKNIPVTNTPHYGTDEVADHAIALTLALVRQLFPLVENGKKLSPDIPIRDKILRIKESTFSIIGLGAIGTAAALKAKALGFNVLFYDPYIKPGIHKSLGIQRTDSLDECISRADVLSLHCPLTEETHYMITERELALMKPTAFLVNTARGAVVKKTAILDALNKGTLAGAGLDVIEDEPLKTAEEANTPNLLTTCHAAFCSVQSIEEMRSIAAEVVRDVLQGKPVKYRVN